MYQEILTIFLCLLITCALYMILRLFNMCNQYNKVIIGDYDDLNYRVSLLENKLRQIETKKI